MPDYPDQLEIAPLPGRFNLTIDDLPGSKSLSNRALLLAALARGHSTLRHVLFSDDTRNMMEALEQLNFQLKVDIPTHTAEVEGRDGQIVKEDAAVFLGNAGTAVRFLTAALCLGHGRYQVDGTTRMRHRPIGQQVDALMRLGATIHYNGAYGYLPLWIESHGLYFNPDCPPHLPNDTSSQFISAVIMVGPYCQGGVTLHVDTPVISSPYVWMTVRLMQCFGAEVKAADDLSVIRVEQSGYKGIAFDIEPDASNASYFLTAAAMTPGSRCKIDKLGSDSIQGDARFVDVLAKMGAEVSVKPDHVTVTGPARLRGVDVGLNDMPDMAQTLAVAALFAEGQTVIRNVGNLRVKETDRLAALQRELTKLGATVRIDGNDITITPPAGGKITPAAIDTYDDHRMAMSFALAGLRYGGVAINDPSCVKKTFPDFFDYLQRLYG
ncbi:MAG: 3-phosphoshikimate 1-carboxyvinyltransferase [Phycisphaeraceae bacterium]|nr:3-phosphoshikimate 1-carboxyvinyltransferase [Phycisphaeraceae bacterium]